MDLGEAQQAYRALAAAYLGVLSDLRRLPAFVPSNPRHGKRKETRLETIVGWPVLQLTRIFCPKYLVRLSVGSHLHQQLREFSFHCGIKAETIDRRQESGAHEWLASVAESTSRLSEQLPTWRSLRGTVTVLWPVAAGIAAANVGATNVYEAVVEAERPALTNVALLGFFPFIYLTLFLSTAFACKRRLLFPLCGDTLSGPPDVSDTERNTYRCEQALSDVTGWRRRREFPLDLVAYTLGATTFGAVPIAFTVAEPGTDWVGIAAGLFFLACAVVGLLMLRRRIWR